MDKKQEEIFYYRMSLILDVAQNNEINDLPEEIGDVTQEERDSMLKGLLEQT